MKHFSILRSNSGAAQTLRSKEPSQGGRNLKQRRTVLDENILKKIDITTRLGATICRMALYARNRCMGRTGRVHVIAGAARKDQENS